MGAFTPSTFPSSVASFTTNTFDFDPLVAGETISISAQLSSGQGVLKRGQVLCGWAPGTARNVALSTTGSACAILAQDIDTGSGSAVMALVYVQGKFLVTAMTASGNGMELDSAELWNVGVYVMTVEQRSGLLVPWRSFPATPGVPLPQSLSLKDAREAVHEEVDAIKAGAMAAFRPGAMPDLSAPLHGGAALKPAWAIAAFGEDPPSKLQQSREEAAVAAGDLSEGQRKEAADLTARQNQELADLYRKQQAERDDYLKRTHEALATLEAEENPPRPPKVPPLPPPPPPASY